MLAQKFEKYVSEHSIISKQDRVLVCVSGGVDSMVLLHLIVRYMEGVSDVGVAHCNFMLRGGESEAETAMVERVCGAMGITPHVRYFDTKAVQKLSGDSTQMTARKLRYEWFEELAKENGYQKIVIAHHSDDATETFFINLMRGTGVRGLCGISGMRGNIVRPLLFASRAEIESYALVNEVEYMTDSSNLGDDYLRSRLRYDIIPRMEGSSPSFRTTMGGNIERLGATARFVEAMIRRIEGEVIEGEKLHLTRLSEYGDPAFILYELLRPYGFSGDVVEAILGAHHSGKRFHSPTHLATLDRGRVLLLQNRQEMPFEEREITEDDPCVEFIDPATITSLVTPPNIALLSADSIDFPLRLRRWSTGDSFIPLGMHGMKKVSDLLIDIKVPLPEKERQGVVTTASGTIVWVVGRRIDDRYKVTERTARVLRLTL